MGKRLQGGKVKAFRQPETASSLIPGQWNFPAAGLRRAGKRLLKERRSINQSKNNALRSAPCVRALEPADL